MCSYGSFGVLAWLGTLRTKASYLSSLKYLRPEYLGLTKCHPIFTSCGSSPWEVEMATTQARMISGRYRVEALSGHWTPWNRDGLCTLPECWGTEASHRGTIESMLISWKWNETQEKQVSTISHTTWFDFFLSQQSQQISSLSHTT